MPMLYKEVAVDGPLAELVKCIWVLEKDYRGPFPDHEHLWADINGELIFASGSPYYLKTELSKTILPPAFVIGPCSRSFDLYSDGFTRFVAVRFYPWGFYEFSQLPMDRLVDEILPATEVFGPDAEVIAGQVGDKPADERIEIVRDFLKSRVRTPSHRRSTIHQIGSRIISGSGRLTVQDLAEEFNLTARSLERAFREQTGMSPKRLSRIVRFNHAKRLIERDPTISLSELAAEAGYADQSHFTRTFQEMFGITPATFKSQVRAALALNAETNADVVFLQDT